MSLQRQGIKTLLVGLALTWFVSTALAQATHGQARIHAVDTVGMTVADMGRSLAFYTQVLSFTPVSDVEVTGSEYEHLQGVFGLRMRVVRLRLGDETIILTEHLAPRALINSLEPCSATLACFLGDTEMSTPSTGERTCTVTRSQNPSPCIYGLSESQC